MLACLADIPESWNRNAPHKRQRELGKDKRTDANVRARNGRRNTAGAACVYRVFVWTQAFRLEIHRGQVSCADPRLLQLAGKPQEIIPLEAQSRGRRLTCQAWIRSRDQARQV